MKSKFIVYALLAIGIIAIVIYSLNTGETTNEYIERIKTERKEKDLKMKSSSDSPFKNQKFDSLSYFPVDPEFNISAKFITPVTEEYIFLPTSDQKEKRYKKYGIAEFELNNKNNKLLILELANGTENDGHLFIPFGDATSADETYGGGRYLDIEHNEGEVIVNLDFNNAYNPYCAYAEGYSCPIPPSENLLDIPVEAGEKTYK